MHENMEIQKLGDGLQRSTQIKPLNERLLEIGRWIIRTHLKVTK